YFPSPGLLTTPPQEPYSPVQHEKLNIKVTELSAFFAEVLGTLLLALAVFALTDDRNLAAPLARLAPVFIGLTVAFVIRVIAPLPQPCLNPARDFGPRVFAYFAGWGEIAIPGSRSDSGFFTVYILAPTVGAVLGGALYVGVLRRSLPAPAPER